MSASADTMGERRPSFPVTPLVIVILLALAAWQIEVAIEHMNADVANPDQPADGSGTKEKEAPLVNEPCSTCGGTGHVMHYPRDGSPGYEVTCPTCGGSGLSPHNHPGGG